ncbi:MAG TPA: hypothetical protein VNN72_21535 [Polyangiaceae bacterium]|nr:hypothetical protein [Polyangiaceae bacterium]
MRWSAFLPGGLLLALAAPAFAEASSSDKAAAEALFDEGRRLAQAGKFAEGCPKLEASQKLDPALGTLLNLADCNEKLGKTASAWAQYREATSLARAAGSAEREKFASDRSKALEPHLSTLTIRVAAGDAGAAPIDVKRDGIAVDSATLGSAIPVDPGAHEVTAASPGMKTWSTKVDVGKDAAKVEIEIPKLEPEGATAGGAAGGTTEQPAKSQGSSMRPVAIAIGAVGLVGIGVGTFFGLSASSSWSDAKDSCTDYPKGCSNDGVKKQESASTKATVSTVAFIAGGAALAVGTVLWFTAGSGNKQTAIGIGPGMIAARGSF